MLFSVISYASPLFFSNLSKGTAQSLTNIDKPGLKSNYICVEIKYKETQIHMTVQKFLDTKQKNSKSKTKKGAL